MKNRRNIILRTLCGVLAAIAVTTGIVGWSGGINCDDSALKAIQAYTAAHPEYAPKYTPEAAATMYALVTNKAIQVNGGTAAGLNLPDMNTAMKKQLKDQIKVYQSYVVSLQKQYKDAMAVGNVAYAQQCVNLTNVWNAKIAELNNQLALIP